MLKKYFILSIIAFTALFFFVRIFHIEESLNFGSDQGATLLETYNLFQEKKITLISQTGSSFTSGGRYIFFSSFLYYFLLPILLIFRWNPLSVSYFLMFLQFVSLCFIIFCLWKKNLKKAIIFALLFIFNPLMIEHSRFLWTPNFLVPLSNIILALILLSPKNKPASVRVLIIIGFLFGLGFGLNYSYILVIGVSVIWLKIRKCFTGPNFLFIFLGFIIAMSPLILFELRHNLYNLRTLVFILQEKRKTNPIQYFQLHIHYLLALFPFIMLIASEAVLRLKRSNKYLAYFILVAYIVHSLSQTLSYKTHGYNMVEGWNYPLILKTKNIILSQKLDNYNIVDLLTGDTRAMAIRFLLTVNGNPPKKVTEYPDSENIYVYSRVPIGEILTGSLWEIDVIKPVTVVKNWQIQDDIRLYLITREKKTL